MRALEFGLITAGALIAIIFARTAGAADMDSAESVAERWSEAGAGGTPSFVKHVAPLFNKVGCSTRSCHGSFQGQNGFRLSLFGARQLMDCGRRKLAQVANVASAGGAMCAVEDHERSETAAAASAAPASVGPPAHGLTPATTYCRCSRSLTTASFGQLCHLRRHAL